LDKIRNDFKKYLHNPSQKIYEDNTFVFDEDSNYGDMLNDFRKKIKHWALALNNNNKHKTASMLNISHRTMENWK
jgi:transcriptional regulator with PAS, ATPase and Fis domain